MNPIKCLGTEVFCQQAKLREKTSLSPTGQIAREDKPFGDNGTANHEDPCMDILGKLLLLPRRAHFLDLAEVHHPGGKDSTVVCLIQIEQPQV